jgi:CBS domain-containing protein
MNTEEIRAFLATHAPFDALDPEILAGVAATATVVAYAPGESALVEDAAPADHLFVVRDGLMELVHEGEVVDVLEPGESFGHPSLLTGRAPAFTVRAGRQSSCYLIPRERALEVFSGPAGAGYVAATLRNRLVRAGHVVHALPELGTTRVGDLVTRPPVFCHGGVTVRKAAETMTEHDSSAILVQDGNRISILTDAILRERVIAGDVTVENAVFRVVQPAVEVDPDRGAVDAIVDMLDAGTDHVVVVDRMRTVLGVLSAADLAGLETRSPFALRHALLQARSVDELVERSQRLKKLFLALLGAGVAPVDVARVLSLQADTITRRLIDLSIEQRGPAPAPWTWLALGSTARRELTLGSDQEHGLAFADDAGDVDGYFSTLGADVTGGLEQCGFAVDPNEVVARSPLWRMSEQQWVDVFRDCLESPDRSHLIRANVSFDFRASAGSLDVAPPLVAVLREVKDHPGLLRLLARSATGFKPPLGFRGALVVDKSTEGPPGIDLKHGGTTPIVNLARFFALSNGITISSTIDRLKAVEAVGAIDSETAAALCEAFEIVMRIRLEHHAAQIEAGAEPDNIVDPATLSPLTRAHLREAFRAVAHAQKRLSIYTPMGV